MSPKNANELILVVDDDEAIRWTLREALQSWGFASADAGSVAEAIKNFNADLPAAVLLDIDLPDGSGLDDSCPAPGRSRWLGRSKMRNLSQSGRTV